MTYLNQFDISLWQACDTYYREHQALYLQLQDEHEVNVNLLLLSTWLDKQTYQLLPQAWSQLTQEIRRWEERVLLPYRKLRKLSKNGLIDTDYQQMLDVELMLERKAQALILHKLRQLPQEGTRSNFEVFLELYQLNSADYLQLAA
ncbi:TIGR02444 family protein [Shewanella sp. D64]|uniref:TIGR02444 family protein n=1 Tax=unclassified Shewanella TaxID=196818 RepID=UPI0022BA22B8|nr:MULTISPECIES: TIGR02444 family protein [unclassified Shewanella]MEC4724628.1 TIGR02444 family protein [Shewanella sp. D64]MEC4736595.1 TIGR02444 family protein [Shewanella sp. E94]WBJ94731.1 TIGR02444 family protein [Shewanella sp. MTB7]